MAALHAGHGGGMDGSGVDAAPESALPRAAVATAPRAVNARGGGALLAQTAWRGVVCLHGLPREASEASTARLQGANDVILDETLLG